MRTVEDCLSSWAAPSRILNPSSAPESPWVKSLCAGDAAAEDVVVDGVRRLARTGN